jgi:hypothetical protein
VIHSTSVAVSREHRRAKTDRLDTAMLMRVFVGWLRGERGHCSMVAVPNLDEEDARRPGRERESPVGEQPRSINRMKAALARFGVRGFKPELRRASAGSRLCGHQKTSCFPRTHWPRSAVTWRASRWFENRSRRSSKPGWKLFGDPQMIQHPMRAARNAGRSGSPIGQQPRATGSDPDRVAIPGLPEEQRAGSMVRRTHIRHQARTQDYHDRGAGPKTADRSLAPRNHRRRA